MTATVLATSLPSCPRHRHCHDAEAPPSTASTSRHPYFAKPFQQAAILRAAAAAAVTPRSASSRRRRATTTSAASSAAPQRPPARSRLRTGAAAALQLLQLAVALAGLIAWPALLFCGRLTPEVRVLLAAYFVFFAAGSVVRTALHGGMSSARDDAQRRPGGNAAALAAFIAAVPACHWAAMHSYAAWLAGGGPGAAAAAAPAAIAAARALLWALLAGAVALNWWAALTLGRQYDRVVAPSELVTGGPYALARHPIYTSYMALFSSYCLLLRSPGAAVALAAVCALYYGRRTALEEAILAGAFGERYAEYRRRVPARYLPGLL